MKNSNDVAATAKSVQEFYEECLAEHGPNQHGMNWGDNERLIQRFHVMADLFIHKTSADKPLDIVDIGSGAGLFYDYLQWYHADMMRSGALNYRGIDISSRMVEAACARLPGIDFKAQDLITQPLPELSCDYAVMNGVFTVKEQASHNDMMLFAQTLLKSVYASCRRGVAVNFMTKHVDWEKDRLFHYPLDEAMAFFKTSLSRHVVFRHDYGLWEYTAYVLRDPSTLTNTQDEQFVAEILNGR